MRKNAFVICLSTLVAGVFGFFLHWLHILNGFEESGLAIPGALTATVYIVYSFVALALFIVIARVLCRRWELSREGCEAIRGDKFIPRAALWAVAAIMALACLILMFSSDYAPFPTMQRLTAALGIFSAVCLPLIPNRKAEGEENTVAPIAAVIPVVFGALWLVTAYRIASSDPVLWSYVIGVLAIMASTLAFYYIAAFFYGRAKPATALVMLPTAAYLCLCTLMDSHSFPEKLLFACLTAAFILFEYLLIDGMKEKEGK